MPQTWLIVGASRGIGLEFVTQLLARGDIVIATARTPPPSTSSNITSSSTSPPTKASKLWPLTCSHNGKNLIILECDVSSEDSIKKFTSEVKKLGRKGSVLGGPNGGIIDVAVINAGVLEYPGRICEITFSSFAHHMHTNTIGPLLTAQHIISLSTPSLIASPPALPIYTRTLVFTSSDSGSTTNFRSFEDGFGAYAASKAALNQGLRHLAAEIHRKSNAKSHGRGERTVVLAIHPGEVTTDMASNVTLDWEVEGVISPEESIRCMLRTIAEKGWGGLDEGGKMSAQKEGRKVEDAEASFWTWEGNRYPW